MAEVLCPIVVGRTSEMASLASALDDALAGRGSCIVITGEAGIGKSRLVREVTRMAGERGAPTVSGRAVPASTASAYRPITEALLQLLRSESLPDDASFRRWTPHLAPLLPGIVPGAAPAQDAGSVGADAIRAEAVLQLLRRLSSAGLVVALEDMHWADPDTVALLDYLADNVAGEPLLLVASVRTEVPSPAAELVSRLRGRAGTVHLALGRLPEDAVADMIEVCCPDADPATRDRILSGSDGVPLLVEELLASPGIPTSVTETVASRLGEFPDDERAVIEAAAVIGHNFDWEILGPASGQPAAVASRALSRAVERVLVTAEGDGFRFRHALTREAVLTVMLPPRVREAAASALAAVDAAHPYLDGPWREVAADLALRAGIRTRAGRLLTDAGRSAVQVGALATAAQTLRRAAELLEGQPDRDEAELALVEALALAGRVDEATTAATRLIGRPGDDPGARQTRTEAHLRLAHAAVTASRWPLARHHIAASAALEDDDVDATVSARAAVLGADMALGNGDLQAAREAAEKVLAMEGTGPDARCHAYEIVGRSWRLQDQDAARAAFEAALAAAEQHDLAVWRLRALHELGTVDMLTRVDNRRLLEARRLGEQMGAVSTVSVLDLQLSASFTGRWDLESCDAHAASALELGRQLGLHQVAAKALALMAGSASMRADRNATERLGTEAVAADPSDSVLAAFCRASVGMALFMAGDTEAAIAPFEEGTAALSRYPNAEPMAIRALWPLIQAAGGDQRATATIDEARRRGVDAFHLNRGIIGYAQAVLEGHAGRADRAAAIVARLDAAFVNCDTWADLARFIAAPRALADGWGDPIAGSPPPAAASERSGSTSWLVAATTCCATRPPTRGPATA